MKKQTKQKLIYLRYLLPPVLILLLALVALIPTHVFVDAGNVHEKISLVSLLSNCFEQGREILFAKPNATVGEQSFAKVLLTVAIVSIVLYTVAFIVAIWSAVVAIKLFGSDDEEDAERSRTLFITFFPNRIILSAIEALAIPLTCFPYLVPLIYSYTLAYNVKVNLCAPDALIFAVLFIAAISVLSAITAPYERRFDADLFAKRVPFTDSGAEESQEEYDSVFSIEAEDDSYRAIREEQAERIRELLGKNKDKKQ